MACRFRADVEWRDTLVATLLEFGLDAFGVALGLVEWPVADWNRNVEFHL